MENKDLQYQLICQFLEGKLPPEEFTALNKWRAMNPSNEKYFQEVQFIWEKSAQTKPSEDIKIDMEAALKKVHQQIDRPTKVVPIRRYFLRIASVAAALFLLVGWWMMSTPNSVEMISVTTNSKEQKEIKLPDNSTVWLNENTSLIYPKTFDKSIRKVILTGNAVFEVTHNPQHRFLVESDDISIKVLGTKFNVISNDNFGNSYVHVINGKVQVKNDKVIENQLIITKDMSVLYNAKTDQLAHTSDYDLNQLFWMNNTLEFRNVTLKKVFEDIQKYYEIDIKIKNTELLSCSVNGKFKDKTVDEILDSIQPIYDFEITKTNSTTYKITKGQCK